MQALCVKPKGLDNTPYALQPFIVFICLGVALRKAETKMILVYALRHQYIGRLALSFLSSEFRLLALAEPGKRRRAHAAKRAGLDDSLATPSVVCPILL